jgi:flagellar motor switch/type III secretory pathway protein FliN
MDDFLSAVGKLTVDVGSGWISRYEAGVLAVGDVVRSESDAGSAHRVAFNGEYLCDGSLVVAGDTFAVQVERLEPESPPPPFPERGDEATELLSFSIRVGSVELSLGELSGVGRLSFINLRRREGGSEDAELVVAGVALAAGKVVVIDERLGLRVTRRLARPFEEACLRTTGSLLGPGYSAEPIKDYDFKRPDCFTKRGIDRARELHLEFLRSLQARLPASAKYALSEIDQLCYREWTQALPGSGRKHSLLGSSRGRSREEGRAGLPAKLLVEPLGAGGRLGEEVAAAMREWAEAENKVASAESRPIIVSLGGSALSLLDEDPGLEILASCLRNGWKRVADLRLSPAREVGERVPGDETAYPNEMILYALIESADGGRLELVYPLRSLEACFTALNA